MATYETVAIRQARINTIADLIRSHGIIDNIPDIILGYSIGSTDLIPPGLTLNETFRNRFYILSRALNINFWSKNK